MIRINLLPFRKAKRRENLRMQISVFILSVVFVVIVLAFLGIIKSGQLEDVKAKNASLNKELKSYAEILKKIDDLKRSRKDLQGKLDVIRGLEAQKAGPVQLFDEICMAVPDGSLFLKSLSEKESGQVTMAGVAIDYDTVAQFMTNLENTKTIDTVTLKATSQTEQEQQKVCTFSLTCTKHVDEKLQKQQEKPKPKKGRKKTRKKR
jgi:type IV pilus assembly protein PilN